MPEAVRLDQPPGVVEPDREPTAIPGDTVDSAPPAAGRGDRPLWTAASGATSSGARHRSGGAAFRRGDTAGRGGPYGGGRSGPAPDARADGDIADAAQKAYYADDPGVAGGDVLPLDPDAVARAVAEYQATAAVGASPIRMTAVTDGQAVTVTCRRTVRVPFGQLLGYGDGLERTAIAQARSPLD